MTEINDIAPYGAFRLPGMRYSLLRLAQGQQVSWLGRRLALLARRLALRGWPQPVDAEADGFRLRVHVMDNVSERKFLFMPRFFDVEERAYLANHLGGGGAFIDIGANAGIYTLTACRAMKHCGGAGRVVAVEPNPTMLGRLRLNLELNGYAEMVEIWPLALTDHSGETTFTVSDSNLGESGLAVGTGRKLVVRCEPLLKALNAAGIDRLAGIKIDVEGMEDRVLVPFFRTTPESLHPGFIIIENSETLWAEDLAGLLVEKGYHLARRLRMNSIYVKNGA